MLTLCSAVVKGSHWHISNMSRSEALVITRAYLMFLQSSRFLVSLSFFFSVIISGTLHDWLRKSWSGSGATQLLVSR